jgi:hypothetical protein
MHQIDLNSIFEQVILEGILYDKIKDIQLQTLESKKNYDQGRIKFKGDNSNLKKNLSNFILKRIELRYKLADLIKGKPILKGGRKIQNEKDLDEYIFFKDKELHDLILLHSRTLPNPEEKFTAEL